MQGYIINVTKARDEDIIATILTESKIKRAYRFYGARHSILNLGYKIDFIIEDDQSGFLPRLRSITQLKLPFATQMKRFLSWQQFFRILNKHLKDVNEIDSFYFDAIEIAAKKMTLQNPKRVLIELFIEILLHEGRAHLPNRCYRCEEILNTPKVVVGRSFMGAHEHCEYGYKMGMQELEDIFIEKNTIHIDDSDIDELWNIILRGF